MRDLRGPARLSCGSLSPITAQPCYPPRSKCPLSEQSKVLWDSQSNNQLAAYTDFNQLISSGQASSSREEGLTSQRLALVLATLSTALLGLSAGLAIGLLGVEIGLPLAVLGMAVTASVSLIAFKILAQWTAQRGRGGYQRLSGYNVSPSLSQFRTF